MEMRKQEKQQKTPQAESRNETLQCLLECGKFLGVFLFALFVFNVILEMHYIPSESMEPTISTGSYVLCYRASYLFKDYEGHRGDIVVFEDPNGSGSLLIKRVIAVAGDTVEFKDGDVYLNGKLSEEPYIKTPHSTYSVQNSYDFLSFCASTLSNAATSRAAKLSALTSFYSYLCEKSVYASSVENPTLGVAKPKLEKTLPKYLTLEECKKLLSAVTGKTEARDYCIIFWLLSCGMRLSELSAINLADIKDDKLLLHGKGRKERILHMSKPCMDVYAAYLVERSLYGENLDDKALFISPRTGNRLTGRRIEQIVESYLAMAGLQGNGYSPHKLRHTFASVAITNGADVANVSEALGHSDKAVTLRMYQRRELIVGQTAETGVLPHVESLTAALEPHAGQQDFGEFDMRHSAASEATLVAVEGSVSASLIVLSLIRHQRATIGKENGALGKPELFLILCTQVVSGYHDRCLLC